jgi:hypothetical protein
MHKTCTGSEFNELYPNVKFYKLTDQTETHNGLKYHTGLIIDTSWRGIHFCSIEDIYLWIVPGNILMQFFRSVEIPPDANIRIGRQEFFTDKIILGERTKIWSGRDFIKKY